MSNEIPASFAEQLAGQPSGLVTGLMDKTLRDVFPADGRVAITPETYFSPEAAVRDNAIFEHGWLYAGQVQDITAPGSYVVRDYPNLKRSVILVRGDDGVVRAFHNACRHRCARLIAGNGAGRSKRFTCEYHGWTYDNLGKLLAMPDRDPGLPLKNLGLTPVAIETWCGFIFVNMDTQPAQTLQEQLAPATDWEMTDFGWDQPYDSWTWRVELDVNWKVVLDLFSEGYHVRFVHRDSVSRLYSDDANPFVHLPVLELSEKVRRMTVLSAGEQKIDPVARLARKFGGAGSSRTRDAAGVAGSGINPGAVPNWGFDVHLFLPNFQLTIFGGFWHYHLFQPAGPTSMVWEHRIFFPKATKAGQRFAQEVSRSLQQVVASEDAAIADRNQEGLMAARGTGPLMLHDQEIMIRHTQRVLHQWASEIAARKPV